MPVDWLWVTSDSGRNATAGELIGQGIGNMLAAAGIPGAGATKGTVVNINAGGKIRDYFRQQYTV
jgi:MFS superfamily sulfate permease-like transporter